MHRITYTGDLRIYIKMRMCIVKKLINTKAAGIVYMVKCFFVTMKETMKKKKKILFFSILMAPSKIKTAPSL